MLEPVMPQPMLNPMHPPLAKQLIALSIHTFGDSPLGWRYPAVLFGALAIVAIYLLRAGAVCGPGACDRRCVYSPSSTRCCSCSRGSRCWIFLHSPSACSRSPPSCTASGGSAPHLCSHSRASPSAWRRRANGADCSCSRPASSSSLSIRLMQGWRTQFADGNADDWYRPDLWPGFRALSFRALFRAASGGSISRGFRPALRPVAAGSIGGAAPDLCRQHHDRDRRPHLYEFVAVLAVAGRDRSGICSTRSTTTRLPRWSSSAIR